MQPHPRYQVLEQIAAGDFATVFRGKDLELNRDVAIKQIHPQFLADQRQLERYWQEAQLLASLEHPNIMTIYDIARDRGWLILELMQGSLWDRGAGQPMDLNFLRVALVCALQALRFLHSNGIIHGDVKPRNLLLDKRNWVKLGDFGLAQRVTNDQGSLLKGTTKYMAPERVSDQFGPVSPASDLYSLGFSIYELMCGEAFETLFPGLGAFGRDKQIAWMMWQAAPDRQLPEIRRVLEGVPEDLVHVVQRLVIKDPQRRYSSADEAIRDLKSGLGIGPAQPTEQELAAETAARQAAAQRKKQRRLLALAAAVSLLLCAGIFAKDIKATLFPPPPPIPQAKEIDGVINSMHPEQNKVVLNKSNADAIAEAIEVRPEDLVYVNDEVAHFADLKEGDQLVVTTHREATGKSYQEIRARRPQTSEGRVKSVQPRERTLVLTTTSVGTSPRELILSVPNDVPILFNGRSTYQGRKLTLADLLPDDRIAATHKPVDAGRVATSLAVQRVVALEGIARGIDPRQNTLTIALGKGNQTAEDVWPFSPQCEITVNRKKFILGQPIVPANLRPGDEVSLRHDSQIVSVAATRVATASGQLKEVAGEGRQLMVQLDGEGHPRAFIVDAETRLTLAADSVSPADLQQGDTLIIRYDAADPDHPVALQVDAQRAIDRTRWAILVATQDYRDVRLSPLNHTRSDATRLRDMLIKRYRLAPDQAVLIADADRATLEDRLSTAFKRIGPEAQLLVYVAGHAYVDSDGAVYLAADDFQLTHMKETGLPLAQMAALLDACRAADKLLALDTCQAGSGIDMRSEPSAEELIAAAKKSAGRPILTSTTVIAGTQEGQRGLVGANGHGEFADVLSQAYTGLADANGDHRITTAELFQFVDNTLRAKSAGRQSPALILPQQVAPPRLSVEAKKAIGQLAASVSEERNDLSQLKKLYTAAAALAPHQPEPPLLYGLGLLKDKQFNEAGNALRQVRQEHPEMLLPIETQAWSQFQQKNYPLGAIDLVLLVAKLPKDSRGLIIVDRRSEPVLEWVGRLREFAATVVTDKRRPADTTIEKIDQAVEGGGDAAKVIYGRGRNHVQTVLADFEKRITDAAARADRLKLELEQRELVRYVTFSLEAAAQQVMDGVRQ